MTTNVDHHTRKALDPSELDRFGGYILALAEADGRLYYRDQSPVTLAWLAQTVRETAPTRIVELGTLAGLSLRALLEASHPRATPVTAVDMSFETLGRTAGLIPLDLDRVALLQQNILEVDFSRLWGPYDRVLLFVDAHDQPDAPLMEHVLKNALPCLPAGSVVMVDDLWRSPKTLTPGSAPVFLAETVLDQVDAMQCFHARYAPYHGGGSFMGFAEVIPFMRFVNGHGVVLDTLPEGKSVRFAWPPEGADGDVIRFAAPADASLEGDVLHNPLDIGEEAGEVDVQAAQAYRLGRFDEAADRLRQALDAGTPTRLGHYGLAVRATRTGDLRQTLLHLDQELERPSPHPKANPLSHDVSTFLDRRLAKTFSSPGGLTIFAMPKAFTGHIGLIQRNAIRSWTRLTPRPRVILFGDDPGTADFAAEVGCEHTPEVKCNAQGTPLVDALFQAAAERSCGDILAYVNADIILLPNFTQAVNAIRRRFERFLMVGRRFDLNFDQAIDFGDPGWDESLIRLVENAGIAHGEWGLDYFVHTAGFWGEIPPFALGRSAWDNWLISAPLRRGQPVVDATALVTAVHQSHGYNHLAGGLRDAFRGEEAASNQALAKATGFPIDASCSDAVYAFTSDGRILPRQAAPPSCGSAEFRNERYRWLEATALRLLDEGKPEQALIPLEELAFNFPDDRDLAQRVAQTRTLAGRQKAGA